jgi:hypothetical protein
MGATKQGAAQPQPQDSFTPEAAQLLRRPFTAEAVKFKVQATWPQKDQQGRPAKPTSALVVTYIDARLVVDRLNLIVPAAWQDDYDAVGERRLRCTLWVGELRRRDVGEGTSLKALYSDALKRAAVKFGVGVSLYATPRMVLKITDDPAPLKSIRGEGGKPGLGLTPAGERRCRELYTRWLNEAGQEHFGDALEHGDVVNAVGEAEDPPPEAVADEPEPPDEPEARALESEAPKRPAQVDRYVIELLLQGLELASLYGAPLRTQLTRMTGRDPGPNVRTPKQVGPVLEELLNEQRAASLQDWINDALDKGVHNG